MTQNAYYNFCKINNLDKDDIRNINNADILSVDVEGWELEVLKGIDFKKYTPKVLLVENVLNNPEYNSYLSQYGYKLIDFIENQDQLYIKE